MEKGKATEDRSKQVAARVFLPQEDPMFYDNYTYTYNRPELIKTAVKNGKEFEKIIQQAAIPSTPKKNH